MTSILCMRTTISPRQWQPWTAVSRKRKRGRIILSALASFLREPPQLLRMTTYLQGGGLQYLLSFSIAFVCFVHGQAKLSLVQCNSSTPQRSVKQ